MMARWGIDNSPRVVESQVQAIMAGELADPTESTLGSRVEAVARMDAESDLRRGARRKSSELARMLGVTKRTIERYRAKIRLYTLG